MAIFLKLMFLLLSCVFSSSSFAQVSKDSDDLESKYDSEEDEDEYLDVSNVPEEIENARWSFIEGFQEAEDIGYTHFRMRALSEFKRYTRMLDEKSAAITNPEVESLTQSLNGTPLYPMLFEQYSINTDFGRDLRISSMRELFRQIHELIDSEYSKTLIDPLYESDRLQLAEDILSLPEVQILKALEAEDWSSFKTDPTVSKLFSELTAMADTIPDFIDDRKTIMDEYRKELGYAEIANKGVEKSFVGVNRSQTNSRNRRRAELMFQLDLNSATSRLILELEPLISQDKKSKCEAKDFSQLLSSLSEIKSGEKLETELCSLLKLAKQNPWKKDWETYLKTQKVYQLEPRAFLVTEFEVLNLKIKDKSWPPLETMVDILNRIDETVEEINSDYLVSAVGPIRSYRKNPQRLKEGSQEVFQERGKLFLRLAQLERLQNFLLESHFRPSLSYCK